MMPSRIRTKILVVFYIISAIPLIGYLILYFQFREQNQLTDHLIEKQQPTALAWVQLMNGINHSIAAQRGWVLFGSESFKKERIESWENEIDPMLEQLKNLYGDPDYEWERAEETRHFYDVRLALLELKKLQQEIEAIAHLPENIPALQLFAEQVQPAFRIMIKNLGNMLEDSARNGLVNQQALQVLTESRGILWFAITDLHDYVERGDLTTWERFQESWAESERLLLDIQNLQESFTPIQLSHFRQFLKNRQEVEPLLALIYQDRNKEDWNIARHRMATQTIPMVRRIEESIRNIVQWQSDFAKKNNRALQDEFERWRIWLLAIPLGIFFLGVILSIILGRRVVKPLRELRDAVRKVKHEDFDGHLEITTQDEVGELALEFEEMLIAISERTKQANRGRQILESSPFPVMLATPDRELVYINPAALRELKQFGEYLPVAPEELIGKSIDFMLDSKSIEPSQLASPYTLPPTTDVQVGHLIVEITFSPLFDAAHQFMGPVLHWKNATQERNDRRARLDLVARLEAEGRSQQKMVEQLEEQNEKLLEQVKIDRAQAAIAEAINSLDIGSVLDAAVKTLVNSTNSQLGILYLDEHGDQQLRVKYHYTVDQSVTEEDFYQVHGFPTHVFQTQKTTIIRYPAPEHGQFHLGGISSYPAMIVGYPLVFRQKCMGVFVLASVSEFNETTLRFIENTVLQLAVSIQNAMTFQTVEQQRQYLETANLELEAATRTKSEFLANMSHELRTPLNAIIGFTETLLDADEDDPLTDYQKDRLNRVNKSGEHLLELINSILDLSKIEARKMQVNAMAFDLEELLREVLGLMEALVANKPIELKLDVMETLPQCRTDQDKIRQILINLLGNAIKFTQEGSVTVIASSQEGWINIDVADTGCGIPPSQIDTIFEAFRQVDGSETRKYEGTGLGLALVKNMTQLIGGDVSVTSESDSGSTFSITFPAQVDIPSERAVA